MGTTFDDVMAEAVAAEFRRTLGLMPWPAFQAVGRARYLRYLAAGGMPDPDPLRRTGRSTRGALVSLARCVVLGAGVLHVAGSRSGTVVRLVKDLAGALRLPVRVVSGSPDHWRGSHAGVVFHADHHAR